VRGALNINQGSSRICRLIKISHLKSSMKSSLALKLRDPQQNSLSHEPQSYPKKNKNKAKVINAPNTKKESFFIHKI